MFRRYAALVALITLALAIAWLIRFGCDDAFISYVYARGLVRGDGLTWFGDHVEGYTNFAWVLWIAGGLKLGVAPLVWSWVGSLASMAVVLMLAYRLATVRGGSVATGLCTVALLATNFTFVAYGTSGLETMLQCALLTAVAFETERIRAGTLPSVLRASWFSVAAALAMWTRLDSAVVLAVLGVVALRELVRLRAPVSRYVALLVPAAVLVGGWLAWKLYYYGELLPNTFHAKVAPGLSTFKHGAWFVGQFLHAYLLWVLLAVVAIVAVVRRRFSSWLPASVGLVWFAYITFVGGDFMEFRFLVPILPLLFLVIAEGVTSATTNVRVPSTAIRGVATVVLATAVSWRHAATFEGTRDRSIDSIRVLATFYGLVHGNDWSQLGAQLNAALQGTGATLASNGAGAIPYYADLPTVDQLGLTDSWVARHGSRPPPGYMRPGHQRFATQEYLERRHVTFVVGSPTLVPLGSLLGPTPPPKLAKWSRRLLGLSQPTGDTMIVVGAPVATQQLLLWYLSPTPAISARIQAAGWEVREIVRSRSGE